MLELSADVDGKKKFETMNAIKEKIWYYNWQKKTKELSNFVEATKKAYTICIKLCLLRLITQLEGTVGFDRVQEVTDGITLLILIHGICCKFDNY